MPLYGYHQPSITLPLKGHSKVQVVEDHLQHQQEVHQILKDNLITSKNKVKQQVNQHHSERCLEEGDWLFFRMQPYKQISIKQLNKDNKLAPKYHGPQKVLQKIGSMTYKLELPASSRVHPVFHVSCLKKAIRHTLPIQIVLLEVDEEGKVILEPKKFSKTRTKQLRNHVINEYLVKWKNLPVEYSIWEDESFIQKHPQLTLC